MPEPAPHILLVCTVGGSHEPVVQSILATAPARVVFLQSRASQDTVAKVLEELAGYERPLPPGAVDRRSVADEQSLSLCVADIRKLTPDVQRWLEQSPAHAVNVDFTAGTKVMSAALALVAHRWPCRFTYIGGSRRDKDGLGIVESGSEKVFVSENPWDALAYQPLQDVAHLFNHHQPAAAVALLEPFIKRPDLDAAAKRRIIAVQHLARAYAQWDAFRHGDAAAAFHNVLNAANDFDAAFPDHRLTPSLTRHRDLCHEIAQHAGKPSRELVLDLLANARRRAGQSRFDDAVARLYRAIEALAQWQLQTGHHIDAGKVPLDSLPDTLRNAWRSRADGGNPIKLGLRDDYQLLLALNDPLGGRFSNLGLDSRESPLVARNASILAHGWQPVSDKAFDALFQNALKLADVTESQLVQWPTLPST